MKRIIVILRPFGNYLLVFWIVAISVVSSIPHLPEPKIETVKVSIRLDYLFHFCEYGALIFLTLLSRTKKDFTLTIRKYIIITLLVIAFALADEFHQKLIPGRTFNVRDILSNVTGTIAGMIFCYFCFKNIATTIKNAPQDEDKSDSLS